jgi:5'-nucleotidase
MINWQSIDHVLLDMDGTLLDLKFDNEFWQHHVPLEYAKLRGISEQDAKHTLFAQMMKLRGTLQWYSVDFWADETGLNILELKRQHRDEIRLRDGVIEFLSQVRDSGRAMSLVTNAHDSTLEIKFAKTRIGHYFDHHVTSHGLGAAKESQEFWHQLRAKLALKPARCLFIDDSDAVLDAARQFGIGQILQVVKPDSSQPAIYHERFLNLESFEQILPPL